MKQGDIVILSFPFADLSERKVRPAVVLSNAPYNRHKNVIVAGVYGTPQPRSIPLTNASLTKKKLMKDSYIGLQNLFSIERSLLGKTIDSLTPVARAGVLKAVRGCF